MTAPEPDPVPAASSRTVGAPEAPAPAYYAARPGGWRDWWTVLHPPYTAWHLSYVAIGAALAPHVDGTKLLATVLAFFGAVGVSAHALDELHGRPLRTRLPAWALGTAAAAGLAGAVALGIAGLAEVGPVLVPFLVAGPLLVVGYDVELLGGRLHTDTVFAGAWGAFPLLVGFVAQTGTIDLAAVGGAVFAFGLARAQRSLSTPARTLRRRTVGAETTLTLADGTVRRLDAAALLVPLERALRALSWGVVALAIALVLARLG